MTQYINTKIYTDVKSYRVFDIDGKHAKAIEVEKRITPKMVAGGFSAICLNNDDFNKTSEVFDVEGAEAFDIELKNGVWGYWYDVIVFSCNRNALADADKFMADNPGAVAVGDEIVIYAKTKNGKRQRKFEKLGVLCDTCRYYYDFNF